MVARRHGARCARRVRLTAWAGVLAVGVGAAPAVRAADYPLEASVLVLKDSGARQRVRLLTAPTTLTLPSALPSTSGGSIEVRNPTSGEDATLSIPPGDGWSSSGSGSVYSYVGRFANGVPAPIRTLRLKQGSRLKLVTRSTVITLDEASQGALTVVIAVGENRYCVRCDAPAKDVAGTFVANKCAAPATCSLAAPAVSTTTTTLGQATTSSSTTTLRPTTTTASPSSTTTHPTTSTSSSSTTVRPTTTSSSSSTTLRPSTSTTVKPSTTSSSTSTLRSTTTTTIRDTVAPSIPSTPSATPVSCSRIDLAWGTSSDTGGSGLAGYRLYRNNAFLTQVTTTAASDTGLAASTVYAYQVSAIDHAGNESARSATTSTNTPACPTGGSYVWARQMGGPVLADAAVPASVAVDAAGNVVTTGVFYGTVDFGTGAVTSAGGGDMFVAKYSATGVPQWVRRFGDPGDQFGEAIATDASGNVYVTGYFFGTVDFGGGPLVADAYDIVLAKYAPNGAHVWSKRIGGPSYEMGQAIAVDAGGNVLVGGQFAATVDFGGGPLTSAGGYDGFLAKYTTAGVHVWSKRVGGASLDTVTGLGVDASGNPTIVGYFQGTSSFGGANLTSAGGNDVFVARYTAAGAHQWSMRFGDASDQRAYAAAVDGAGNVVLTGYFDGTIGFGGPTFTNVGGADIFLAKLTSTGAHAWSKAFGSTLGLGEVGKAVAIDGAGNVLLTGDVAEDIDFGGGLLTAPTVTYDVFVAKFSAAGAHQWSKRFASDWDDHGNAVAADVVGNVILGGDFYQSENFGGGLLTSPGGSDGFVLKLTP